jgi:hypothetical protein
MTTSIELARSATVTAGNSSLLATYARDDFTMDRLASNRAADKIPEQLRIRQVEQLGEYRAFIG